MKIGWACGCTASGTRMVGVRGQQGRQVLCGEIT